MRHRISFYVAVVVALAGCAGTEVSQTPTNTAPDSSRPLAASQVPNPSCPVLTVTDINTDLHNLFFKNAWPDENSTKGKFKSVQDSLDAGNIAGARTATKALIAFINNKQSNLTAAERAASQALYDKLISDLWCFVGISGLVFDLNPGDPVKTFEVPAVGGVQFPANVVPVGTLVAITDLTNGGQCPLVTVLDCFPGFLAISTYPAVTLLQPATVVLCPPSTAPAGLVVAHQDDTNGFEILNPVVVPAALQSTCANTAHQPTGPAAWFAGLLKEATNVLLPRKLAAAPVMFGVGGIGGTTIRFSPFAAVGTTLTAVGGTGGTATKFAPPAGSKSAAPSKNAAPSRNAAPNAAPPNNPPLPPSYFTGAVGATTFTGLPSVTIATPGGDPDGVNKVPGVTVTFTTAPSLLYDLDSNAKVCDAQGNIPASGSIAVVTDANGVATLPCLAFGNKAGFANLSATFDPSTLNFPNVSLVTVVAQDGTSSSNSLNWLVKSAAGLPTQLAFVQTPSTTAGAGVAFGQQPSVQLLDALGNEVYTAGINIAVAVTAGGGTAAFTAPVTTDANGLATFTNLSVGGKFAGVQQTLAFSFTGITQPLTSTLQLTPGVASQLEITTQPSATAQAGVAIGTQPAATIEDQYGNVVNSAAAVTASLASGSPTLAGTLSVNAVGGVATFTDLQINGATGPRTLKFTSPAGTLLTSAPTGTIDVSAGPATQLVISRQPSASAPAGSPFAVQPIVTVQDQFGNPVTTASNVTALLASGSPTLAGTTSIPTVNGVGTFTDLRIDGATGNRTLQFTSGSLTSPATTPITITPGALGTIRTYMGGVAAQSFDYGSGFAFGATMAPAPQVLVADIFGNPVAGQTVYWSATTANGGALAPSSTATNAAGLAQATSWQVGFGANNAVASLYASGVVPTIPGYQDAVFAATAVNTGSLYACAAPPAGPAPNAKADVGSMSIKAPPGAFKKVTLRLSLKNTLPFWSISLGTLEARLGTPTGKLLGLAIGGVLLPGNGNQVPATFRFLAPVPQQASTATIWFVLKVFTPHNRQVQLWYLNTPMTTTDPCYSALLYTPGSSTVFNRGLSIDVIK